MVSSFWEAVKISCTVIFSIIFEWWIVFLFLLSIELCLGFWILWLLDFEREFVAPLGLISLLISVGIPLRERYIVEDNSILQRSADWMRALAKRDI